MISKKILKTSLTFLYSNDLQERKTDTSFFPYTAKGSIITGNQ